MSQPECTACTDLREYAPEFVMSGVTENIAASLKNNTGLNPALTVLHDNCEDLQDVVDCLIGRLAQELEGLDVCDWKDYMSKFSPNLYETLKAMVMSDCGQWSKIDDMCAKIDNILSPPLRPFGIRPYTGRNTGTLSYMQVTIPSGTPSYIADSYGAGIRYGRREYDSCKTGECELFEWIAPWFFGAVFTSDVPTGTVLWSCSKSEALNTIGMSNYLWELYTLRDYTWAESMLSDHRHGWFRIHVVNGRLSVIFEGTDYPSTTNVNGLYVTTPNRDEADLVRHACGKTHYP